MKKETLLTIKRCYESLQEGKRRDKVIWDRIEILEQNPLVKEYIELKQRVKMVDPQKKYLTNEEILEICSDLYLSSSKETNNIYVYIGKVELKEKGVKKDYKRYINLEARYDNHLIPIEESELFESTHEIINAKGQETYKEIQKEFMKTLMEEGQEKACKKVLSKKY